MTTYIPCECGAPARWHGALYGPRLYCCDRCWRLSDEATHTSDDRP